MTLEEVVQTKQALEAEGVSPSLNQVLKRLGYGSKRDVQRLMAQLVPAPPPPEAAPPPRSAFGMALMGMDLPDRELPAVAPAPASLAWHQARVAATQAAMEAASAEELAFATRNTHLRQKLSACKKQLKHLL